MSAVGTRRKSNISSLLIVSAFKRNVNEVICLSFCSDAQGAVPLQL